MLAALAPFALLSGGGEAVADPDLVPIVRFMGATKLALALAVAAAAGLRYGGCAGRSRTSRRLGVGIGAAACMGAGAGLIWSGAAFGGGFAAFLVGALLAGALVMRELAASLRRRP